MKCAWPLCWPSPLSRFASLMRPLATPSTVPTWTPSAPITSMFRAILSVVIWSLLVLSPIALELSVRIWASVWFGIGGASSGCGSIGWKQLAAGVRVVVMQARSPLPGALRGACPGGDFDRPVAKPRDLDESVQRRRAAAPLHNQQPHLP